MSDELPEAILFIFLSPASPVVEKKRCNTVKLQKRLADDETSPNFHRQVRLESESLFNTELFL